MEAFIYAYKRYGVRYFIVDSLMKLGIKADDWNGQKELMEKLTDFVDRYDVHTFLVAHSRKTDSENRQPGKLDVKGAGELTDEAHNIIVVWRNKKKELKLAQLNRSKSPSDRIDAIALQKTDFDTKMDFQKQRNGDGSEPTFYLQFEKKSRQFSSEYQKPINFLESTTAEPDDVITENDEGESGDGDPF